MRVTHTNDSLKMIEFLQKYPNQWHSIAKDKRTLKAFDIVHVLYKDKVEFKSLTNQMRLTIGA